MSLIHEHSCECLKSELELFQIPPTQTSLEQAKFRSSRPIYSIDRGGPIEFIITPGDDEYVDLSSAFLYTVNRILDSEGKVIPDKVGSPPNQTVNPKHIVFPINYFAATRFRNVSVLLNSKQIGDSDNLYAYRAYLETLLSYGDECKRHQLRMSLWYPDTKKLDAECFADLEKDSSPNKGAQKRFNLSKNGSSFECVSRVHNELFSQDKLLPNTSTIKVKFHRADPEFSLMSKETDNRYMISIDTAILYVRYVKISSAVRLAHQQALEKNNFKYAIPKTILKFFSRAPGREDLSENNLSMGVLPKKVIVGLLSTAAFHGNLGLSPFNFQHFNVSEIKLRVNGETVQFEGLELDFAKKQHFQGYISLLTAANKLFHDSDIGIDPVEAYPNGMTLYGFDLTADEDMGHFQLLKEGKLSLDLRLTDTVSESVTLLCYLCYDTVMEIDKEGIVYYGGQ